MPKIPNYTKQQSLNGTKGEAIWSHDEKPAEVILTAYEDDVTVTVARINDPMDSTDREIIESERFNERNHTKSVESARSWATKWMKNHPWMIDDLDLMRDTRTITFGHRSNIPEIVFDQYPVDVVEEQPQETQGVKLTYEVLVPRKHPDATLNVKGVEW